MFLRRVILKGAGSRFSMPIKITTSLPKPSDKEIERLVQQLHNADVRLRDLLGDRVDAVLDSSSRTFLLRRAQAVGIFALNRDKVTVVISDMMMMPIMDGTAAIAALRQIDTGVKIITASGLNSKSRSTKSDQAGVKHFLAKPYATGTMLIVLRKVLAGEG